MLSFESDYITGAHPKVLEALVKSNDEVLPGYGEDAYTRRAKEKIRTACAAPDAQVVLLTGGTQTNATVISLLLEDCEGVISADTGHIALHEAGAVEYTGHKVLSLPAQDGKISPEALDRYLTDFYADGNHIHMVFPGMVYISHPTEYGTLYSKDELTMLSRICQSFDIPLYMDGARLGYALASPHSDLTLPDIAALCDAFYIGGTKTGALCGEAVVFSGKRIPSRLVTRIKQHGALLAKGRLTGVQFDALFTDGLYLEIGHHAIQMAQKLENVLKKAGYRFYLPTQANQIFLLLENETYEALRQSVAMSFWEKPDAGHTVVRLATCWSTTEADIDALAAILRARLQ